MVRRGSTVRVRQRALEGRGQVRLWRATSSLDVRFLTDHDVGIHGAREVNVFELRVYGDSAAVAAVSDALAGLAGVRHLSVSAASEGSVALARADVRPEGADAALAVLDRLGIPADDVVLTRLDTITAPAATTEPMAIVWADVLGRAQVEARAPGKYFVLMGVAGVVAAFAVLNTSSVLIVGAMAISPDLLPIVATCTGVVLLRRRLVGRGLMTFANDTATT